jgi:hypothetical protein
VRNPLENEETAFRFVLGTIAYLAPIVVASWIATWLGVIVFVIATGVVVVVLRRGTHSPPAEPPSGRAQVDDTPAEPDQSPAGGGQVEETAAALGEPPSGHPRV